MKIFHFIWLFSCLILASCTPHVVREAETVVAQADSLWQAGQMYGVDQGDSATLAQAYETLKEYSAPSLVGRAGGEVFSHACYHYGKLLRAKDNPVAAMECFIAATHSRSRDYHILGRVYSNMGSICHLAGEFQLSYDMYEKSAEMFLLNGDTLAYYYGLNNMAFELAMLSDKTNTLSLIEKIENECIQQGVQARAKETKAELYLRLHQYDSAIYYANQSITYCSNVPSISLIKAQSFSYKAIKDSAVYYAYQVLSTTSALSDNNNALYIITNNDQSKDTEHIRATASERADIQKLLEIRQGKLSQAIQLLEQDLNRKPDYRWLYAILTTLIIIGVGIYTYTSHKRRLHKLLSQEVDDMRHEKESLQEIHKQIVQEHNDYTGTLITQIQQNCIILRQSEDFPNNIYWKEFNTMSKIINDNFGLLVQKLHKIYHLQEREIRLCILVLFDTFNSKQQAKLLFYSESGIRNFKNRVAKKLGTNSTELRDFLINLAINEHSKCTP